MLLSVESTQLPNCRRTRRDVTCWGRPQDALDAYKDKADDVAALFEAETRNVVPEEGKNPSIG
jgi:hypothetical protein